MSAPAASTIDALSSTLAQLAVGTSATHTHVSTSEDILPQPSSRLLSLPTELRLLVCSFMTLSPESADSLAFRGAYTSCRRLHQDMRDQLDPSQDLPRYIAAQTWNDRIRSHVTLGGPTPFLGLIRDLTIRVPIPPSVRWQKPCSEVLPSLYSLYLDRLHVVLTGAAVHALPYADMKSFHDSYFIDFVKRGVVNCRNVTFTIHTLSRAQGGREKRTTIENLAPESEIRYRLTIVEGKGGKQVERAFESDSRFRPDPV
jgi:hypothetical protein